MRKRYYVRTRYHVWSVMRRHNSNLDTTVAPVSDLDTVVEHIGARGRGDRAARALARETVETLNQQETA